MALLFVLNSIDINAIPEPLNINNIAPTINLSVTPAKKPVDIVILTDYTGTKLTALKNQINTLRAQLIGVNASPDVYLITDVKNIGTQQDELYKYRRYARYNYQVDYYKRYTWSMGWTYAYNKWFQSTILWEETQGLASQFANLPLRNPQNIGFTRSYLKSASGSSWTRQYYDVTINATNDVKSSGAFQVEKYYNSSSSGYYNEFYNIISEYATVDTKWTREEKVSDVNYNIYSLNFDSLNTVPLRTGSDRHMIFLSDATAKDYSKGLGEYFSFGGLTDTVNAYIKNNNFKLYGVMPDITRKMTLLPEKVANVLALGDTTLFYMQNGELWKLGNPVYASQTSTAGTKLFPEIITNIGGFKKTVGTYYNTFVLMQDGTVKYFNSGSNTITTLPDLSNIKDMYYNPGSYNIYLLNTSGQAFYIYDSGNSINVTPFNNSIAFSSIKITNTNEILFLTSTGEVYVKYSRYYNGQWYYDNITRLRIKNTSGYKDLPATIDLATFEARGTSLYNIMRPVLLLYSSGTIQQFVTLSYEYIVDAYGAQLSIPYLEENVSYSIMETNVKSIESNLVNIFIYKNDGITKMLNTDWNEGYFSRSGNYYRNPVMVNATKSVPLTNIQKTYTTRMMKYFFIDGSNRAYMYNGDGAAPLPVLGTTLIDMGTNVNKIIEDYPNRIIYILYNNNTVRQLTYNIYNSSYTNVMLPYTDIKDISVSLKNQTYFLKTDGSVLGKGSSIYGQLGVIGAFYSNFVDPFPSVLNFDKTIYNDSVFDIFKDIAANEFYPTGQYIAAFNSIYKNYSSYSGTGNMYVLLGEDVQYQSAYSDYESDPEYSRQWRISHDPYFFDNSMGLSQYHNPTGFTTSPPVKLDKPGKYIINLKARDNPKNDTRFDNYRLWSLGDQNLTVYVHRKPIALQRITVTNNGNGTYTVKAFDAGSYDLDHSNSRADKGIVDREWRWKESTSTVWIAGQMNKTDCTADKSYITQLRVKDAEGIWSDYNTITINKNNPPVALFTLDKNIIKTSELLKVKDQSYPQSFSTITGWNWVVKKLNADGSVPATNIQNGTYSTSNNGTGAMAGYDINVKTNYSTPGVGKYRVYLRVKNSDGLWSNGASDRYRDRAPNLNNFYSQDITVDEPPAASYIIEKNPINVEETLKLKDTSVAAGLSPITKWHWVVKKLNSDSSVPSTNLQDAQFTNSNAGTGSMNSCDVNVKTLYADKGPGTYRIYLRVMNGNGMWSDGGTDAAYNINNFFYKDLVVQESFKLSNFEVIRVRDLHLESYYYDSATGQYKDRPMNVNDMAIDYLNFGGMVDGLTKGYLFEFKMDTQNFNEDTDTIVITPHFYTSDGYSRDPDERDLYWENSRHEIIKAGQGGHSSWEVITLDKNDRIITGENTAIWRGSYLIPGTAWAVPQGTSAVNAKANRINRDIIVNFEIKGYKNGAMRYDYNLQQWPLERTIEKPPYTIGDVIRYSHIKSNLDDDNVILNRP